MNQKGFTIIEAIIVAVIVCIMAVLVFTVVRSLADGGNYCDMYRYSPMSDVPASCVDYFFNGEGKQQ